MAQVSTWGQEKTSVVTVGLFSADFVISSYYMHEAVEKAYNRILETTGRGCVYIKDGLYSLYQPMNVGKGFISCRGAGRNQTAIRLADSSNCDMITSPDDGAQGQWMDISDMKLDGNAANQTSGNIINIRAMNESAIRNVLLMRPKEDAIRYGQSTLDPQGNVLFSTNPQITNCRITGDPVHTTGNGIALISGSSDAMITATDIGYFTQGNGVLLSGHNGASLNQVYAWQCKSGFFNYNSQRTMFTGCLADWSKQYGFKLQGSDDLQLGTCKALSSSDIEQLPASQHNTYDGFWVVSGNNIMMSNIRSNGAHARYGMRIDAGVSNLKVNPAILTGNVSGEYIKAPGATNIRIDGVLI